jgi:hypothetical protein
MCTVLLQISESFSRFGVSEGTQHLLVARFDAAPEHVEQICSLVKGERAAVADLPLLTDAALVKSVRAHTRVREPAFVVCSCVCKGNPS